MKSLLKQFMNDESGATAIEYGLIAALIGVAIVAGAGMLGTELDNKFSDIAERIKTPNGGQ